MNPEQFFNKAAEYVKAISPSLFGDDNTQNQ